MCFSFNRCEKFISLCDIHGDYLFSTPGISPEKKCCGVFFNPVPIFVNTGTCFTSYKEIWEVWPFTFSYIKIWLNVQSKISPGNQFCEIFIVILLEIISLSFLVNHEAVKGPLFTRGKKGREVVITCVRTCYKL